MQYKEIFFKIKNGKFLWKNFDIFAQNIDCGTALEAVLMSTHNLCFGAKLRKIGIPLHTPILLYKSGVQGGILFMDMFSWCNDSLVVINPAYGGSHCEK